MLSGNPAVADLEHSGTSSMTYSSVDSKKEQSRSQDEQDTTDNASVDKEGEVADGQLAQDATQFPSGISLAFIVIALGLSIFLASLDMTIVATAIPKITDEFRGLDKVSWYGSAFFMTNGGFQSSWGKAYKYFDLKYTFLASIFVFELGSLVCAVAPNSTALIAGRAVAGLGAAGIGTGAYTIIAFVAEPKKRPMFTGIIGISYGIASVLGPLVGGAFSYRVSWRWCFYINLPIGGVSGLIILLSFRAPSSAKPVAATWKEKFLQMDLVGALIAMGALVSYILALQYGGQSKRWSSSDVIGLIVGFTLLWVAFGIWEYFQNERAMVVPRLFKQRPIAVSCLYAFFFGGSYFLVIYYLPIYFQSVYNASPLMSGVYNLPLILSVTVAMIASGIFITGTGLAVPVKVSGAVIAVIGAGLLYTLDIGTSTGKWIGYQILGGVGWGIAVQVPIMVGQGNADLKDMSSITAMILFFQNVGGTSFITAGQSAFVNQLISNLPITAPGVDPAAVVATGATEIREVFTAEQLPGILKAYMAGIKVSAGIAVGATGFAFLVSLFSRWRRLNTEALK